MTFMVSTREELVCLGFIRREGGHHGHQALVCMCAQTHIHTHTHTHTHTHRHTHTHCLVCGGLFLCLSGVYKLRLYTFDILIKNTCEYVVYLKETAVLIFIDFISVCVCVCECVCVCLWGGVVMCWVWAGLWC